MLNLIKNSHSRKEILKSKLCVYGLLCLIKGLQNCLNLSKSILIEKQTLLITFL